MMDLDCQYHFTMRFRIRDDYPGQIMFLACGAAIILNQTAQIVVKGIRKTMAPNQIIDQLQADYPEISLPQITEDVANFLAELLSYDVIQAVDA